MRRYGEFAGDGLARMCVAAAAAGSSGELDGDDDGGTTAGASESGHDGGSSSEGTTGAVEPMADSTAETTVTTGTTESTRGDESSGDETTGTTGGAPSCAAMFSDDFDDGIVGDPQWHVWGSSVMALEERDSSLRFTLIESSDVGMPAGLTTQERYDVRNSAVQLEFAERPTDPNLAITLQLWQPASECLVMMALHGGDTAHFAGVNASLEDDEFWIRLRVDEMDSWVEASSDAESWRELFAPRAFDCDLGDDAQIIVHGSVRGPTMPGPSAAIRRIDACSEPGR